ncbi:hypothetical protein PROFUN_06134 [Planoprotostelium fungivorum]|uniref:Uncharacterized protein n=1 Tax=Planoprotostelium fungivorum TaxID=1890364 RepID=A0A2P6NPH0_9EUKA|nr:hypothetical protein PROFUN_06134 [Planoprotostelium fungivorum]
MPLFHTPPAYSARLFFLLADNLPTMVDSLHKEARDTTSNAKLHGKLHDRQAANMRVAIAVAVVVFCLAFSAADLTEDFPQPPYNFVSTWVNGTITSLTCPADCGNPDTKHCLWNAAIQDTCSATYAEKRVEHKRQTRCQQLHYCGPVCYSDGQGGYACGCVSCGKK